ncbi:LacI family DNA-binding transcriptional regulator [Paenibacillus sp. P96]|uniref:LacI family DNA-binding transcriptional regulator n=1 Tax=Paenibacillus zeirhizosphaerae TaxID=2987519 RepID=A0ABT9FSM6_9BACL|nr:LacI family DNA-binding transcriptional regulator [Paenibacillus sp. P96]MDP4097625.1 LacI family DNA-binding transcriptional regulator [Paenibacillus sp. P96]
MRGKVTLQEIAEAAGVSKFAVSRALAGKPGVSEDTRAAIVELAGRLGYFRQEHKRIAPEQAVWKGTVAVLFPNIRSQNRESKYWGPVFEGIAEQLNDKGLDVLTLTEPSSDDLFSLLNPAAIRGIITVGSISTGILLNIRRLGIPFVMVDHRDAAVRADTLFTDNWACMEEMLHTLIAKGYSRMQFVGNISDAWSFHERWAAYRSTLERNGIDVQQDERLFTPEPADLAACLASIAAQGLPELFVCVNDHTAHLVIDTLDGLGVRVPADCGVTGFDHTHEQHPIAATVKMDKELLGRRSVDQLLWRMMNPASLHEKTAIDAELVVREQFLSTVGRAKVVK